MVMVSSWKLYVRMACEVWGGGGGGYFERRYFGWWSGSSGGGNDGSGGGDAHESRDFGWWSGGSGSRDSLFFQGMVFVTEVECWKVCFGFVGRDIFDVGGGGE